MGQLLALATLSVTTELGVPRGLALEELGLALALRTLAHHRRAAKLGFVPLPLLSALASLMATDE